MMTKALIALIAASMAPTPLYAEDAAGGDIPAAVERRASVLEPLALIPADAEAAAILRFPGGKGPDACLASVAVAFPKGTGQTADNLYTLMELAARDWLLQEGGSLWAGEAKEGLAPVILATTAQLQQAARQEAQTLAAGTRIPPVYLILSPMEKRGIIFQDLVRQDRERLQKLAADGAGEYVAIGKFAGLKVTDAARVLPGGHPTLQAIAKGLEGRSFHLLIGTKGRHAIYVFCEDPADLHFAENAAGSVLNTAPWAAIDGHLDSGLLFAGHVSPALLNSLGSTDRHLAGVLAPAADIFSAMAAADRANAGEFRAAAKAVGKLTSRPGVQGPEVAEPLFLQVWGTPGGFHVHMTSDAMGGRYTPGKTALAGKAQEPATILCVESSPYQEKKGSTPLAETLQVLAVAKGVACSLEPGLQAEMERKLHMLKNCLPELISGAKAISDIGKGLDGSTAWVVDIGGKAPEWAGGGEAFPRIAFRSGVRDRRKLAAGWQRLAGVFRSALAKCGGDPGMVDRIPIGICITGGVESYSMVVPGFFTSDAGPDITLCDTAIAIGTSTHLDRELVGTGTAGEDFEGTRFTLHPAPLAELVRRLGYNTGAAAALQNLAERLEGVTGSSTIRNGIHTIHLDFNFTQTTP